MSSYSAFAAYYDALTQNVPYAALADHYQRILKQNGVDSGILLDLACGTGSLSVQMAERGFDVIAVDRSNEMLSVAASKKIESGNPLYLQQSMQSLDLFGTVDAALCTLDSINHLSSEQDLRDTLSKVGLFLNDGGIFIFDVNTLHKHRDVLGQNVFVYDTESVYCVWQNQFCAQDGSVRISLDFFAPDGRFYRRGSEQFTERYYSDELLQQLLEKNRLHCLARFHDFSEKPVTEQSERITYVCRKERK